MLSRILRHPVFWAVSVPVAVLVVFLAVTVFGVQTLFYNESVDEAFPLSQVTPVPTQATPPPPTVAIAATVPVLPTEARTAMLAPTAPAMAPTTLPTATALAVPTVALVPSEPQPLTAGNFHSVVHPGSGQATVYRQPDGSYLLRLTTLDIFNGPDLYVYAVAAADATDGNTVLKAGFLEVAKLKANQGNQNYVLPAGFDPARYRSISIWCKRFSVNFATAPLMPAP
jgi:hypothetical protein